MWFLIEAKDSQGPGHDETRRIIIRSKTQLMIDIPEAGMEVHPFTPGESGYHCPICHKDIAPSKLQGRGCGEIIMDDKLIDAKKILEEKTILLEKYPNKFSLQTDVKQWTTIVDRLGEEDQESITTTQDKETIIKAVTELRKEFEYMATRKMFNMRRNKIGEYLTPDTFCLWAGYWECAVKVGIIPDKIEYVNEG